MRFFETALLLSSPLLASAKAIPARGTMDPRSSLASPLLVPRAPQCSRELDETINVASTAASSGNALVVYTVAAAGFAHSTCTLINHNANTNQPCSAVAVLVASVVGGILQKAGENSASTGTATSRRDGGSTSAMFAHHMTTNGFKWDVIDHMAVVEAYNTTNNHTMMEHFIMRGLVHDALSVPQDHHVKTYADGTGVVITAPSSSSNATADGLRKRHDGAGFKFNWRRFDYQSTFLGSPDLSVIPNLAGAISQDWAARADNDNMDEYILAGGIDHVYDLGLRIISEIQGFGEEYEDVNICGDLSTRAHDELRRI
jgi:hypothetical protein